MRQADMSGTLTFEPVGAGPRMRWSWQVRPKGAVKLLAPVIARMGRRQAQTVWGRHETAAGSAADSNSRPGHGSVVWPAVAALQHGETDTGNQDPPRESCDEPGLPARPGHPVGPLQPRPAGTARADAASSAAGPGR